MIKLLKNNIIYEATDVEIYPDYTNIYWGPYKTVVPNSEWVQYTIVEERSPDEINEKIN